MQQHHYAGSQSAFFLRRFIWNGVALSLVIGLIFFLAWGASMMSTLYQLGEPLPISLEPKALLGYVAHTVLRMLIAMFFALCVTLTVGLWAAKSPPAARVIIPLVDILQSVPILSFLSISVVFFIALFPNRLLGPECCAIFAIFTSQVWNMVFSFYQSVRMVPDDLREVAALFRLSAWQVFFKIDLPFAMPALVWNAMMSMSASWFFVVLSEAISVAHQDIRLPGVGSYIQVAIEQSDGVSLSYAILAMFLVILAYDQLLFRPLLAWSDQFSPSETSDQVTVRSWFLDGLQKVRLFPPLKAGLLNLWDRVKQAWPLRVYPKMAILLLPFAGWRLSKGFFLVCCLLMALLAYRLGFFIIHSFSLYDIGFAFLMGLITAVRVLVVIVLASLIWIPVGVFIGLRPRLASWVLPLTQFMAAFPANLFYPLLVMAILYFNVPIEIGLSSLMLFSVQWYILFNVMAGVRAIPKEWMDVANNLSIRRSSWWFKLVLPAIFPYYITGALTATGSAWNATIVVEWISWGETVLQVKGLGQYIHEATRLGQFSNIALGTIVMCLLVLMFNHLIWRPLYRLAEERFHI